MNDQAAIDTVTTYLRLVEERRLDEASRFLAPGVQIIFPGGLRFANLDEQVATSRRRYRDVRKIFERFDVVEIGGEIVVYVLGDLEGEDLTGRRFSGIRFIDRFALVDGLIADHRVWNDLAEATGGDVGNDG